MEIMYRKSLQELYNGATTLVSTLVWNTELHILLGTVLFEKKVALSNGTLDDSILVIVSFPSS